MNCYSCISKKTCFLQKQIDGLAIRMTQTPFNAVVDSGGDRDKAMLSRYDRAIIKQDDVERGLKKVIASHCPLFNGK